MTPLDIIQRGKQAVRISGTFYPVYENLFKEAFGFNPECPTCGSINGHKHWDAFVAYANGEDPETLLKHNSFNLNIMSNNTTFAVKNKSKIYAYTFKKKGQDRDFVNRVYGDIMSEEFAIAYLEAVQDDPILFDERKAEFSKLPAQFSGEVANATDVDLSKLSFAELKDLAASKGFPEDEYSSLKSKKDVRAYLDAKALENTEDSAKKEDEDITEDEDLG